MTQKNIAIPWICGSIRNVEMDTHARQCAALQIGAITIAAKKKGKFSEPRHNSDKELEQVFQQATEQANNPSPQGLQYDALDEDEPDDLPVASNPDKRKKILIITIVVAAVLLIAAAGVGTWWYLDYTEDDGLIYQNLYAFDINLGGMTPE